MPLGVQAGVVQSIELTNDGGQTAHWRVDSGALQRLVESNRGFPVVQVAPTEGTLAPQAATHIHVVVTPLEPSTYIVPITINCFGPLTGTGSTNGVIRGDDLLRDDEPNSGVLDSLTFELQVEGTDPRQAVHGVDTRWG